MFTMRMLCHLSNNSIIILCRQNHLTKAQLEFDYSVQWTEDYFNQLLVFILKQIQATALHRNQNSISIFLSWNWKMVSDSFFQLEFLKTVIRGEFQIFVTCTHIHAHICNDVKIYIVLTMVRYFSSRPSDLYGYVSNILKNSSLVKTFIIHLFQGIHTLQTVKFLCNGRDIYVCKLASKCCKGNFDWNIFLLFSFCKLMSQCVNKEDLITRWDFKKKLPESKNWFTQIQRKFSLPFHQLHI